MSAGCIIIGTELMRAFVALQVDMSWEDLHFAVKQKKQTKTILDGISGEVNSGMTCIYAAFAAFVGNWNMLVFFL
jgi:hypothetical protein